MSHTQQLSGQQARTIGERQQDAGEAGVAAHRNAEPAASFIQREAAYTTDGQPDGPPELTNVALAGGYAGAVISQHMDEAAPNIAEIVKARLVIARDDGALQPRVLACLISEFGMTQEDAEALVAAPGSGQRAAAAQAQQAAPAAAPAAPAAPQPQRAADPRHAPTPQRPGAPSPPRQPPPPQPGRRA